MKDWRNLKVGDKLRWFGSEFDGSWDRPCTVVEIKDWCVIAECDGMELTIDDCFESMFKREKVK